MSYSIFKINLEKNKNNVINFWKSNFPSWPENKFTWFYQNNPYGLAACWIIMDTETSTLVGSTALFPRKVFVNGKLLLGGITGDFGVDRRYRIVGPALKLQKAGISESSKNNFAFLYGYPNEKSEPVQRRAGFRVVGSTCRMVKVLKSKRYVDRYIPCEILARLSSKLVDLMLKAVSKENYYRRVGNFDFGTVSVFDKRFDGLWEKASKQFTVIGERSSAFLNWRFSQCPFKTYRIFTMSKSGTNQIVGYIVYYVKNATVNIVDLLVLDIEINGDGLVSEFLRIQRKQGLDAVSIIYFGNEELIKKLKEYKFFLRDDNRMIVAYADGNSSLSGVIFDQRNWYMTEADND